MTLLSLDPSLSSGCGMVVMDDTQDPPAIVASACVKAPGTAADMHARCRFIASVVDSWIATYQPHSLALEEPPPAVRPVGYTRKDGTKGQRIVVSPAQHRLIGQIEGVALMRGLQITYVTPGLAKAAVGLSSKSSRKPVEEVEAIVGHKLADTVYAREGVADAYAVGLAALNLMARQTREDGAQESF